MTCSERCRKAAPGTCCCSCEGAHHGEAAPIQQKRLELAAAGIAEDFKPFDRDQMAEEFRAVMATEREALGRGFMGVPSERHPGDCTCVTCYSDPAVRAGARLPHDRTIEGRTVHLSPGYRYTLDSEAGEPIWFAYFGATHTSAVDPDVAARKALGL